eukprot:PhM_4_TR11999/c0_g1_i1/m.63811
MQQSSTSTCFSHAPRPVPVMDFMGGSCSSACTPLSSTARADESYEERGGKGEEEEEDSRRRMTDNNNNNNNTKSRRSNGHCEEEEEAATTSPTNNDDHQFQFTRPRLATPPLSSSLSGGGGDAAAAAEYDIDDENEGTPIATPHHHVRNQNKHNNNNNKSTAVMMMCDTPLCTTSETMLHSIETSIRDMIEMQDTLNPTRGRDHRDRNQNNTNAFTPLNHGAAETQSSAKESNVPGGVRAWLDQQLCDRRCHFRNSLSAATGQRPDTDPIGDGGSELPPPDPTLFRHNMPFGVDEIDLPLSKKDHAKVLLQYLFIPVAVLCVIISATMAADGTIVHCGADCQCEWAESLVFYFTLALMPLTVWAIFLAAFTVACLLGAAACPRKILCLRPVWILVFWIVVLQSLFRAYLSVTTYIRSEYMRFFGFVFLECIPLCACALCRKQFPHVVPSLMIVLTPYYYRIMVLQYVTPSTPTIFIGQFSVIIGFMEVVMGFIVRQVCVVSDLCSSHLMVMLAHALVVYPHALKAYVILATSPTSQPVEYTINVCAFFVTEFLVRSGFAVAGISAVVRWLVKVTRRNWYVRGARFDLWCSTYSGVRPYILMVVLVSYFLLLAIPSWPGRWEAGDCEDDVVIDSGSLWYEKLFGVFIFLGMEVVLYGVFLLLRWPQELTPIRNPVWGAVAGSALLVMSVRSFGWASVLNKILDF